MPGSRTIGVVPAATTFQLVLSWKVRAVQDSFGPIEFGDSEVEGQGVKGGGATTCPGNGDVFVIDVVDTLGKSVSSCG